MDIRREFPIASQFFSFNEITKNILSKWMESNEKDADITPLSDSVEAPDFLFELLQFENKIRCMQKEIQAFSTVTEIFQLNPTLEIQSAEWNFADVYQAFLHNRFLIPQKDNNWMLCYRHPKDEKIHVHKADDEDLLAIKIVAEELSAEQVAEKENCAIGRIENALFNGMNKGYLLGPPSKITRHWHLKEHAVPDIEAFYSVPVFTLQWHITHACDMHCKHCYDRSKRSPLTLEQGYDILENFHAFCNAHHVRGHVCFSGGNPFLSPHFQALYEKAVAWGYSTSILGNPVPRAAVEEIIQIQMPTYYQISLEGMPDHNDHIRGEGVYFRAIEFLGVLRDLHVTSGVMLTLTKENMHQVLPLGERLRGHADQFTFNRLSPVGEGADLLLPDSEAYQIFLAEYLQAMKTNPILRLKDNLLNPARYEKDMSLFGGCTGYGCGAAFSFLALLPDGEVHACRKFPSVLGNILTHSFFEIYYSDLSQKYRKGSAACSDCTLLPVCGGCMAVVSGLGKDPFKNKDPFCFFDENA